MNKIYTNYTKNTTSHLDGRLATEENVANWFEFRKGVDSLSVDWFVRYNAANEELGAEQ